MRICNNPELNRINKKNKQVDKPINSKLYNYLLADLRKAMDTSSIEKVKKLYEETADSYEEMMNGEIELPIYSDILSRLAERITNTPGPVIDTSCGSGHMLHLYNTQFDPKRSLTGIDLSQRMVEISSTRLGSSAKIIIGDMCDLSMIKTGSAAAVISFFAIHHINPKQVMAAFKEWHRVLSKKGQLMVATWEGTGQIDYQDETDVIALRYKKDELITWALESGFKLDKCTIEPVEEIPMEAMYLEATKI